MTDYTFEEAMMRLQEITKCLDDDSLSLDQSIALFEEGIQLSAYCNQQLKAYEQKISNITAQFESEKENQNETSI